MGQTDILEGIASLIFGILLFVLSDWIAKVTNDFSGRGDWMTQNWPKEKKIKWNSVNLKIFAVIWTFAALLMLYLDLIKINKN